MKKTTQDKIVTQADDLIAEGRRILAKKKVEVRIVKHWINDDYNSEEFDIYPEEELRVWQHSLVSLLQYVYTSQNLKWAKVKALSEAAEPEYLLNEGISILLGLKRDISVGLLVGLRSMVEAEIASDYFEMANELIVNGKSENNAHIPAAVLAGVVLERGIRSLCENQNPKIELFDTKGNPKTLNPLIDDLKKCNCINELKAKQLRAWADIRNAAAHGNFDKFSHSDVAVMLQGVENFLADHLN